MAPRAAPHSGCPGRPTLPCLSQAPQGMNSDWKNLLGTAQFLSTQTDRQMDRLFAFIYKMQLHHLHIAMSFSCHRAMPFAISFNFVLVSWLENGNLIDLLLIVITSTIQKLIPIGLSWNGMLATTRTSPNASIQLNLFTIWLIHITTYFDQLNACVSMWWNQKPKLMIDQSIDLTCGKILIENKMKKSKYGSWVVGWRRSAFIIGFKVVCKHATYTSVCFK